MPPKEWKTHSMGEHYNIAWVVGDPPIVSINYVNNDIHLLRYSVPLGLIVKVFYSVLKFIFKILNNCASPSEFPTNIFVIFFQEINNPYAVESYLKEYQFAHHKLICKVCGISRVSYVGFYAHIIVCGKSEKVENKQILIMSK